jgi:hypothetical protein
VILNVVEDAENEIDPIFLEDFLESRNRNSDAAFGTIFRISRE